MLVILLSVFTLCWLPYQIIIIYGEYRSNKHERVGVGRVCCVPFFSDTKQEG